MSAARRWCCVGIGVLLLVASPALVRALPVADQRIAPTSLLARVSASREVGFSGYVATTGNVNLPVSSGLSGLSTLLGASSKVRVWWRDPRTWRVDTLRPTGETDLTHAGTRAVRWVYESKTATVLPDVPVRLPDTADLLPNELARTMLSGARASELSRLPARRVAGRDALGLRLVPAGAQSSIGRVDVYVDRASGVPLRVDVYGRVSATTPALTSRFLDFRVGRPPASTLAFEPPYDARLRFDDVVDIAAAADRFAARVPPPTLAGLPARAAGGGRLTGSVGVYGRGPTLLIAIPLWRRSAESVRADLEKRAGARVLPRGTLLAAPPLRLLLGQPEPNETSWLLAGTVTTPTLEAAADQLARHRPGLAGQPRAAALAGRS